MIKKPKSVRVITGEQEVVYKKIDNYFDSVRKYIERRTEKGPYFEVKIKGIQEYNKQKQYSEFIHMLLYKERIVAIVTETRDSSNYIMFDFFENLKSINDLENKVNSS